MWALLAYLPNDDKISDTFPLLPRIHFSSPSDAQANSEHRDEHLPLGCGDESRPMYVSGGNISSQSMRTHLNVGDIPVMGLTSPGLSIRNLKTATHAPPKRSVRNFRDRESQPRRRGSFLIFSFWSKLNVFFVRACRLCPHTHTPIPLSKRRLWHPKMHMLAAGRRERVALFICQRQGPEFTHSDNMGE